MNDPCIKLLFKKDYDFFCELQCTDIRRPAESAEPAVLGPSRYLGDCIDPIKEAVIDTNLAETTLTSSRSDTLTEWALTYAGEPHSNTRKTDRTGLWIMTTTHSITVIFPHYLLGSYVPRISGALCSVLMIFKIGKTCKALMDLVAIAIVATYASSFKYKELVQGRLTPPIQERCS